MQVCMCMGWQAACELQRSHVCSPTKQPLVAPAHPSSEAAGLAAEGLVLSSVNSSCRLVPRQQGLSSQKVESTCEQGSRQMKGRIS